MEMDRLINALRGETADAMLGWGKDLWDGKPMRDDVLAGNLGSLLLLAALNETGGTADDPLEVYTDSVAGLQRHAMDLKPFKTVFWEALDFLAKKNPILTVMSPRQLDPFTRQTAFFVSSVMKGNLVQKVKDTLLKIRTAGGTRSDFLQQIRDVAEISAPHIETVFRTNVMSAAGAARLQQFEDPDVADLYVAYRYASKADARGHPYVGTRPLHAAMNGFMAVKDDPIWRIIWTPNGYNCRCACRGVRRHQAIEAGIMDETGRIIAPRVYATDLQRVVAEAAMTGGAVQVEGKLLVFPDEGFRGNAMAGLVAA